LFTGGPLSFEEVTYAYVLWKFSYQFLNRFAVEYDAIAQVCEQKFVGERGREGRRGEKRKKGWRGTQSALTTNSDKDKQTHNTKL
jgi:hypothetical protein